jgi:hypothetical protein
MSVKYFSWSKKKNDLLRSEREISFEDVVFHIETGFLLDVLEPPDQENDAGQRVFVIQIDDYAYLVPFLENDREIFPKTIIPSRKATRHYLKGAANEQAETGSG